MRKLYQNIRLRVEFPQLTDVAVAALVTIVAGSLTGEAISRPVNSYVQAACALGTLVLGIITLRMAARWLADYISENQNQNQ